MKPEEIEQDIILLDLQSMVDDIERTRKPLFDMSMAKMTPVEKLRFEVYSQQMVKLRVAIKNRIEELLNEPV